MARPTLFEIFTSGILILAIAAFLTAWGRIVWTGAANVPPARFVKNKNAGANRKQSVSCNGNAVYYNQAVWQFPCQYRKYKPDSDEYYDIVSGFNRWNIEGQTNELSWQMPELEIELEIEGSEYYESASDYLLFAFAPRPDKPEQIAVGVRKKVRNYWKTFEYQEGRETLSFYILDSGENKNAKKFGETLQVQRSEVSGVDWKGDELEVVMRTENGAARIYSSSGAGEWKARDITDTGCGKNQKCQLEVAFREQNNWQFVYSRLPLDNPGSISDVNADFWQVAETGNANKFAELSAEQLGNLFLTRNAKNVWSNESFDASPGNVLARDLSRRPFQRVNKEWKQLDLPLEKDGSAADLRFTGDQGASYFDDGNDLTWFPVGKYRGKDIRVDEEWLNYQKRWLSGKNAARYFSELLGEQSESTIKIRDVRTNEENIIVGANGGWWFYDSNADAMPMPNGDLLIFNFYNDYVRLNSNFERADKLSLVERFNQMIDGNFWFYGEKSPAGYIYNPNFKFAKQASIPLLLLAFPLFLLIGAAYRRFRKKSSGGSLRMRGVIGGASVCYLTICLVFGYYFWILTGFF